MSRARAEWQDAFDLVYTPDDDDRKKLRSSLQDMEAETWKLKKRESSETLAGAKTTIGDLQQFEDPSRAIFQQLAPIRSGMAKFDVHQHHECTRKQYLDILVASMRCVLHACTQEAAAAGLVLGPYPASR